MNVRFWQKVKVKFQHLLVWSRNRLVVRISKHTGGEMLSHGQAAVENEIPVCEYVYSEDEEPSGNLSSVCFLVDGV